MEARSTPSAPCSRTTALPVGRGYTLLVQGVGDRPDGHALRPHALDLAHHRVGHGARPPEPHALGALDIERVLGSLAEDRSAAPALTPARSLRRALLGACWRGPTQVSVKMVVALMSDAVPLATMVCAPFGPCFPPVGMAPLQVAVPLAVTVALHTVIDTGDERPVL